MSHALVDVVANANKRSREAGASPMDKIPPRGNRGLKLFAVVICVLWMIVIYFLGPQPKPPGNFGDPIARYPAEFDWMLSDLHDKPVRFDAFKGKPIFLNIWATWCGPCVSEMPSIARLARNPRLQGKVEFVCVATDSSSSPVRQYIEGKGWTMTFLRADSLPRSFQTDGIPATFAISPEGIVVGLVEGSSDWDHPEIVDYLVNLATAKSQTEKK